MDLFNTILIQFMCSFQIIVTLFEKRNRLVETIRNVNTLLRIIKCFPETGVSEGK